MEFGAWGIVALLLLVVFLIVKIINKKQDLAVKLVWTLFIFFTLTIAYKVISYEKPLNSVGAFYDLLKIYVAWLGSFLGNIKEITGDVISLNWLD